MAEYKIGGFTYRYDWHTMSRADKRILEPSKWWRHERDWYARNAECRQNRTALWAWLLEGVDRNLSVIEVGAGQGQVLDILAGLGFTDLTALDINEAALAHAASKYRVILGDIQSLPLKDESYDLVLTSGTLIHVPPMAALLGAVSELKRVSRCWVAGFEYWASEPKGIAWRGQKGIMWKCDFPSVLREQGLSLARTAFETHISGDIDCAYLATK